MILIENSRLRSVLKVLIPAFLIPAALVIGALAAGERKYAFVSFAVAVLAVVLFITGFEKKNIGTRRLVISAVMIALSVAGRFIPLFKPVTALTVISAIYLGGECGFLIGSFSALISNFYFGQGPWTPFQMTAWGLIGLFAGLLASPLLRSKILLLLYGFFSGIAFSLVMDVWTVVWYNGTFDLRLYSAALLSALPFTLTYAVSNVIFLLLTAGPFGRKLRRIKIRYGV